jgi:hypothetical protein
MGCIDILLCSFNHPDISCQKYQITILIFFIYVIDQSLVYDSCAQSQQKTNDLMNMSNKS